MGCHFLLQRIFPTQGPNPCLLPLLHRQAASSPSVSPEREINWFVEKWRQKYQAAFTKHRHQAHKHVNTDIYSHGKKERNIQKGRDGTCGNEIIDIKRKEEDGGGVGGQGVHLSPTIQWEYTFRHRSTCRTPVENEQEYLTSGKEYTEPCRTW